MYLDHKVLDVHGHVSPPLQGTGMVNMLLRATNTAGLEPLASETVAAHYGLDGPAWEISVGRHVQALDERGIDVQLIGPRPFLMSADMPQHVFATWTRFVNDSIAKQCRMAPTRFVGACQLPQDRQQGDAAHCLPELRRCVDEHGFAAVYVSPDEIGDHGGHGLADSWWNPLYEECERVGLPVIIHGTTNVDPRLAHIPQNYQMSFVAEQYWAGQSLSHSDVFTRYPDLRVIICHCGGSLDRWIPTDSHLAQQDLSTNLFYDTCAHDIHYLEAAIKQRTPARLLFGTEAPGSGGALRPETGRPADDLVPVIGGFGFLTEAEKVDIFHNNAARLLPEMAKL